MITAAEIQQAAKLYEARDSLKRITGDEYPELVAVWAGIVHKHAEKTGKPILSAAVQLAAEVAPRDEIASLWLLAAAVELIELEDA